jgi:hypothetical protein
MARMQVPSPISGGVLLTYKCPARCRHCVYASSPDWQADLISEANLDRGLAQLAGKIQPSEWGRDVIGLNDGLHFSGGEPFLNFDLLLRAVEMAEFYQIPSTFVETNSSWCLDDDVTRDKLQRLRVAGMRGIMISVNPFYAEYVPFEYTERCVRISLDVFDRANVVVYQLEYFRQFKVLGLKGKLPLEAYVKLTRSQRFLNGTELFTMGRATRELRSYYAAYKARVYFHQTCQPLFLRRWHNHFDNYGNYMPGFCGGISLGSWFDLDHLLAEGIELDERPILNYLVNSDMEGLFHFAQDFGYQEAEQGYISRCHLCLDIRKYLAAKQDFIELRPKEFYEHV